MLINFSKFVPDLIKSVPKNNNINFLSVPHRNYVIKTQNCNEGISSY